MNTDYPLVSVIVKTYNSSCYILETLQSIREQIYQPIELIISDDCSTDNTVELCEKWIKRNSSRFVRCEIITVPYNTGVTANCKRSVKRANGVWIKGIAGDDTLCPNCISDNIAFIQQNPEAKVVHSVALVYNKRIEEVAFLKKLSLENHIFSNENILPEGQYKFLLRKYVVSTCTMFIKREIFNNFSYDETIPMIEDLPFFLTLTKNRIKLWYMNIPTVNYRVHNQSISHFKNKNRQYSDFFLKRMQINKKYIYPYITFIERFFSYGEYYRLKFITSLDLDRDFALLKMIWKVSYLPFYIFERLNLYFLYKYISRKYIKDKK